MPAVVAVERRQRLHRLVLVARVQPVLLVALVHSAPTLQVQVFLEPVVVVVAPASSEAQMDGVATAEPVL
jgi:hypothetical protein